MTRLGIPTLRGKEGGMRGPWEQSPTGKRGHDPRPPGTEAGYRRWPEGQRSVAGASYVGTGS